MADNTEDWLDDQLTNLVDEWANFMLRGKSPDGVIALKKAKAAILTKIKQVEVEARIGWHKSIDGVCLAWNDSEQIWERATKPVEENTK